MRISADRDSPHWVGQGNYFRYSVQLDGKPVKGPIEADDVAGWVTVYKRNEFGMILLTPERDGAQRETLHGKVTIIDTRAYPVPKPAFGGILG